MTVRLAMKYGSAEAFDLTNLARQEDTALEQKFDGTRALAVITPDHIRFLGHGGKTLSHTAATQHFDKIRAALQPLMGDTPGEIVLDGEIMCDTGRYVLFDVPYVRAGGVELVRPTDRFADRRAVLANHIKNSLRDDRVVVARQARTLREKQALIREVTDAGGEGLMVKHIDSTYEPGKRVNHSLKVKFVKTADVFVTARNVDGACNAALAAYKETATGLEIVPVGGCSMIGKPDAQVGDVIEVAYLYWTGARLYQPRMMRKRPDKALADCRMDQFQQYSRAVL